MKLALLDLVVCPRCGGDLAAVPFLGRRSRSPFGHDCALWCARTGRRPEAGPDQSPACGRCHRREIVEGVLRCASCGGAYPIHAAIPELLPAELANSGVLRDVLSGRPDGGWTASALFRKLFSVRRRRFAWTNRDLVKSARAGEADRAGRGRSAGAANGAAGGSDYKRAEVRLTRRADLPDGFFNPGLAEPFVSVRPSRSIEKILRFMIPVRHADWRYGDLVLDLGVGYAWTTEWLRKLGFNPVGVDLNRDYLRVGIRRTEGKLPPLLVADVENLPIRPGTFHGALFFDAFHHIAAREAALKSCAAALVPGGSLVMAEPGPRHEADPASVQVMATYGILEKGVSEPEFRAWAGKAGFADVKTFPYEFGDVEILMATKPGTRTFTSAGPSFLSAGIVPDLREMNLRRWRKTSLTLTVRNDGDTVWLRQTADGMGRVRIGIQLKNLQGGTIDEHYLRLDLPRDVAPGETVKVTAMLPAIGKAGEYNLEIDGVAEGIVWFKDISHRAVNVRVRARKRF